MSIFTISLRIRAIDPIVIEKLNERARKAPLSLPSSSLTYKLWGPSAVMARPLPNPRVSPQKFIFLLSLVLWSHWTTLLSPAAWAGFQMHFPWGTSRGRTSKTAGFPEHQPAAAYLKPGETSELYWNRDGWRSSLYEKTEVLGMRFRTGVSGGHVILPWNSIHKGSHFYTWGLCAS